MKNTLFPIQTPSKDFRDKNQNIKISASKQSQQEQKMGFTTHQPVQSGNQNSTEHRSPPQYHQKTSQLWTPDDFDHLYSLYSIYGPKWANISKIMNKNNNIIKNKFYGSIRKLLRKLQYVAKKIIRPRKIISYQALIRPIEALDFYEEPFQGYNYEKNRKYHLSIDLKERIINYSRRNIQAIPRQECESLIDNVHHFNLTTRSFNLRLPKQGKTENKNDHKPVKGRDKEENLEECKQRTSSLKKCIEQIMDSGEIEKLYESVTKQKNLFECCIDFDEGLLLFN